MMNVCTVSDKNYLYQGLCLYESLIDKNNNIKMHYLCIDDYTYNKLLKLESQNLSVYNVDDFLKNDSKLCELKNSDYKYFCWSLASYFSNYILKQDVDSITYIDSDIYFHQNINLIYECVKDKDIGIFRHRQFDLFENRIEGLFNVGVVFFRKSEVGLMVNSWWLDAVLNKKYPELATCGDQKYLENFLNICNHNEIMVDGDIGHGAPWQWQLYDFSDYEKNGNIIWNGNKQKLVFTHFSQFEYDETGYIPSKMHHIYTPLSMYYDVKELKLIYDEYYTNVLNTKKKYN